ncbi:serine hydrolase [Dyadobacter sp. CY356]|uniref:serine hydrolase domain-containing protein n=1 Tax=Dyadobacter sp. CY356 TaxID=2906442 RepID=UPI001F3089AC|nr:serine hydrolase domain-containing protein [Dyadobacter sp. CY356]MCF0055223.1 beta-lactamase family protein [Dyadobacter sp. CY356]
MKFSLLLSFILLISIFCLPATCQVPLSSTLWTAYTLDSLIEKKRSQSGMVGLAAAIIIDNKVVWTKGYGYADLKNKKPFTPNTIINIGSISKTFTGVCMMKAVEDKKLSLDRDINDYLPFKVINPYYPAEKITLKNLATHTSGITDRTPIYDSTYFYGGDHPTPLGQFLKSYFDPEGKFYSKENFLNQKPGSFREYSNIAAGLAGYIVELAAGMPLNEYSKQRIFKPLNMKNSGWLLSEINLANHSKLYDKQTDTLKTIPLYGGATYPDGGVRTSVADLSKFFISMLGDGSYQGKRMLQKISVETMERFQFTPENKPENIELKKLNSGLFWATKMNVTQIGHGGTDPGVKTEMLANLSKDVAVILFSNTTLTDKDLFKYYFGIYQDLWTYGLALKAAKQNHKRNK